MNRSEIKALARRMFNLMDTPEEAEVLIAAMRTAPIGPNGKINLLAHLKGQDACLAFCGG